MEVNFADIVSPLIDPSVLSVDPTSQGNRIPWPPVTTDRPSWLSTVPPATVSGDNGVTTLVNKNLAGSAVTAACFTAGEITTILAWISAFDAIAAAKKQSAMLLMLVAMPNALPAAGTLIRTTFYANGTPARMVPGDWVINADGSTYPGVFYLMLTRLNVAALRYGQNVANGIAIKVMAVAAHSLT